MANKTLMGPTTRTCTVPKEVLDAMPQGILQMAAYRGEANFVYPPKPADPKAVLQEQGVTVPAGMQVKVVEDTDQVRHLTLPTRPAGELAEGELVQVAGGRAPSVYLMA